MKKIRNKTVKEKVIRKVGKALKTGMFLLVAGPMACNTAVNKRITVNRPPVTIQNKVPAVKEVKKVKNETKKCALKATQVKQTPKLHKPGEYLTESNYLYKAKRGYSINEKKKALWLSGLGFKVPEYDQWEIELNFERAVEETKVYTVKKDRNGNPVSVRLGLEDQQVCEANMAVELNAELVPKRNAPLLVIKERSITKDVCPPEIYPDEKMRRTAKELLERHDYKLRLDWLVKLSRKIVGRDPEGLRLLAWREKYPEPWSDLTDGYEYRYAAEIMVVPVYSDLPEKVPALSLRKLTHQGGWKFNGVYPTIQLVRLKK